MIKFENITKTFSDSNHPAVKNLTLEIPKGKVCVLVGPSGCGKTTTMKMVNRLVNPTEGRILINDNDNSQVDPIKLRLNIGYVIQNIGLFPHMTIAENVATVLYEKKWLKEEITQRVHELLDLVGLDPEIYQKRRPSALSGGQQQRVGVARALAANSPIMLMDEPFGAVDPITRNRLQNEFLRLQQQMQKTIIFVTHDIDEAIKMGDLIAIMSEGELVQYCSCDELLSKPANEFVENLIGRNRSIKRLHLIHVQTVVKKDGIPVLNTFDTAAKARAVLDDSPIGAIAILESNGSFKGTVGSKEIQDYEGQLGEVAVPLTDYIEEEATLNDALSVMLNKGEGYVAVLDQDRKFVGVITLEDIFKVVK